MYITRKVYSHSLVHIQLRLSNLFVDSPLIEAWSLPPLTIMVGGEVKKPVEHNRPLFFVIDISFLIR